MYVEPLDPANLDRLALQVQSDGLLFGDDWSLVPQVIDMYSSLDVASHPDARAVVHMDIDPIVLGSTVRDGFVSFFAMARPTFGRHSAQLTLDGSHHFGQGFAL